ncbi:MAG: hypothetical protein OEW08_09105 [Gammaproteobacteria bacterium]|nr:hypothetical protein [Gammaproteobacteria bacterium]
MSEEHTLLLGEIKGQLTALNSTVANIDGKIDKMDTRLRAVETRAAIHGAAAGGVAGVGMALLAAKIKTMLGA